MAVDPGTRTPVTAVLFVASSPERWLLSVRSLLRSTDVAISVGVRYPADGPRFEGLDPRVTWRNVGSVAELVDLTHAATGGHVLVVDDAVTLPPDALVTALRWLDEDVRIASVSFLSNAADTLSFPTRNLPVERAPDGTDEVALTRRLRSLGPAAEPAPVPVASGCVVLLASAALGAVGRLEAPASARFDVAVADFSCRARAKGFVDVVDTSTFVLRGSDTSVHPVGHRMTADDLGWLLHRHRWLIGFLDAERVSGDSPFAAAHQVARVKAEGLRILVDGSCFGPNETGTQVATREVIRALGERDDVRSIAVAMPGRVPAYAATVLGLPKVDARPVGSDLGAFGPVDIAYRPFQPTELFDLAPWRSVAPRFLVSILDVIAYANGSYFPSGGEWMAYRSMIERVIAASDAVTVISHDVANQMKLHGLVSDPTRVEPVPLGADHLRADVPVSMPDELRARGWSAMPFAVCLGTNYGHKNRELAMDAHRLLAERGLRLGLVLAGAAVPYGTTRLAESARLDLLHAGSVVTLPEVSEPERNWLLRHASLVWYPSSAEGFGLVPFEAAVFGTPTVAVGFGPLAELAGPGRREADPGGHPRLARDWTPESLVAVAEEFLRDPQAARLQVDAVRRAGMHHRWDRHAAALTDLFRRVLARPRVPVA